MENLPGFKTLGITEEIQKFMNGIQCEREHFNVESSSCPCSMALCGEKTKIQKIVLRMLQKPRSMLADSLAVVGHSWTWSRKDMVQDLF